MTKITKCKTEPRNSEALHLLDTLIQIVKENPDTTEVLALVKIGPEYRRFSTGVRDMTSLIATLEVAKFDCLQRMSDD